MPGSDLLLLLYGNLVYSFLYNCLGVLRLLLTCSHCVVSPGSKLDQSRNEGCMERDIQTGYIQAQ